MARCALTVDVEEYFQVSNFDSIIDRSSWSSLPSRVVAATRRLLDCFEANGHQATFFVLGWVAERHGALVREIEARGHEVACHGFGHELVYEIGPVRFRSDLRRARAAIEDAAGVGVRGYRAPSYSITDRSGWALRILVEEGFEYDSSIFPIRHPRYGIPDFSRRPVRLALGGGASIVEFPLTTARLGPLRLPVAGGAYLRFMPAPLFRALFGREVRAGRPTVLYLHPWEIDASQPRQRVTRRVAINHYTNLHRTEERVRRLLAEHSFGRMDRVLEELESRGALPLEPFESAVPAPSDAATIRPVLAGTGSPEG